MLLQSKHLPVWVTVPSYSQWSQELSSLTGAFEALHHPNEPQDHGGRQQRSLWNPPEKADEVKQLCHSKLLMLGADGDEGELTGTESHAGDPQDPSQHKDEKDFVAPKAKTSISFPMMLSTSGAPLSRR